MDLLNVWRFGVLEGKSVLVGHGLGLSGVPIAKR